MKLLHSSDQYHVYSGLLGLYALAKRYELEQDEGRIPFYQITEESFGMLEILTSNLIKNKESDDALLYLN